MHNQEHQDTPWLAIRTTTPRHDHPHHCRENAIFSIFLSHSRGGSRTRTMLPSLDFENRDNVCNKREL